MQRTRVKICGITNIDDAQAAITAGADAIGLVFYAPSPRAVNIAQAKAICTSIPPFVTVVALAGFEGFVTTAALEGFEIKIGGACGGGGCRGVYCLKFDVAFMF